MQRVCLISSRLLFTRSTLSHPRPALVTAILTPTKHFSVSMASKRPRQDEAKTEEDDWTKRPPYAPEDDKPRVAKYTGSCHW